jgi:hypothetical protein
VRVEKTFLSDLAVGAEGWKNRNKKCTCGINFH